MRTVTRRPASDGRAERDAAIARVDRNAPGYWKIEARAVVSRLSYERQAFTTDDVWDLMENRPPEPRALGAVMVWARNRGYITATEEMRESERPEAHRNPKRVWHSNVYNFAGERPRAVPQPVATAPDSAALKRHEPKRRGRGAQSKPAATPATHRPDPTAGMTEDEKDAYLRKKSGL